jgi:hypothetical protein
MLRLLSILISCSLAFVFPAWSADMSVAPGADIQAALDQTRPGDTITLKAGVHAAKIEIKTNGTAGARITLKGEPGAVLSGKGVDGANMILLEGRSYWTIQGLEIRENKRVEDGSGIRLEGACKGIHLRNNRIHDIRGKDAMGITVYGSDAKSATEGLIIDGNEIYDCDPAKSEALTLNGNISDFAVTNNRVHDVNNIGIDFIAGEAWVNGSASSGTRNGVCRGNIVYRCRSNYGGGYAAGIYVDGGTNIILEKNIVTQCDLGIEVGAENKGAVTSGIVVRDNTIFYNDKAGLVFGGYERDVGRVRGSTFSGNTLYQNNRHRSNDEHNGELWIQWADGNTVSGNIIVAGEESPLVSADHGGLRNTLEGNTYFSSAGQDDACYMVGGEDATGLRAWQLATKQDGNSTFRPVTPSLPSVE